MRPHGVVLPPEDSNRQIHCEVGRISGSSSLSLGYDEPEILRYSNRHFGPIGADAGHRGCWTPWLRRLPRHAIELFYCPQFGSFSINFEALP